MKKLIILLGVAFFAITFNSCGSQSNDNTSNNQTKPIEQITVPEEKPQSNPIDRFVGRYSIKDGGPNVIEVLSDGRIIFDNVGNKRFLGKIEIISNDAFMISSTNPSEKIYVSDDTPIYRISNGVERNGEWSGDGTEYTRYLVFDVNEMRMYNEGYNKYMNRDIAEVRYMKLMR